MASMSPNIEDFARNYDRLWEEDCSIDRIVNFCRAHLAKHSIDNRSLPTGYEETEICSIWRKARWGEMVFQPVFLKHLYNWYDDYFYHYHDDDALLAAIGEYIRGGDMQCTCESMIRNTSRIFGMGEDVLHDKVRAFFWFNLRKAEGMWVSSLRYTDLRCVDNVKVRNAMMARKHPGHQVIPAGLCLTDCKHGNLPPRIQAALEKDSVSLFNIEMTLSGKRISMDLLNGVLYFNAYSILAHLLRNRMDQVEYRLAPKDLLRHLCAKEFKTCKEEIVDIVDALEEAFPGICKETDLLGNTPLWYCLYHPNNKDSLVEALKKHGCDPGQRNSIHLNYRICRNALTLFSPQFS